MAIYRKAPQKKPDYRLLGLCLHKVSADDVHHYIKSVIESCQKALVLNLNIHCVNLACETPWLKDFLNQAQLVFCDGDGVRWGIKVTGSAPPPKITYAQWMWELGAFCSDHGYSMFLLGAKPEVAAASAAKLQKKYPRLLIAGTHHGYFKKEGPENETVIAKINEARPHILIVGFGMPYQEKWLKDNWERLDVPIFLTGGAVFDYVSGNLKRAPRWMLRLQLEWLFRLCQEPKRLFSRYVIGNPLFFIRILREKLKRSDKSS